MLKPVSSNQTTSTWGPHNPSNRSRLISLQAMASLQNQQQSKTGTAESQSKTGTLHVVVQHVTDSWKDRDISPSWCPHTRNMHPRNSNMAWKSYAWKHNKCNRWDKSTWLSVTNQRTGDKSMTEGKQIACLKTCRIDQSLHARRAAFHLQSWAAKSLHSTLVLSGQQNTCAL